MNPGGRGCNGREPRSHHCTPAWVTRVRLRLKKKNRISSVFTDDDDDDDNDAAAAKKKTEKQERNEMSRRTVGMKY